MHQVMGRVLGTRSDTGQLTTLIHLYLTRTHFPTVFYPISVDFHTP
jgi:hypothetical protein